MRFLLPCVLLLGGCALLTRSKPLEIRRFSPEAPEQTRPRANTEAPVAAVMLGQVSSGADLGRRVMRRTSPVEVERSDELWWTESPDVFVERSLSRALFDDRPLQEAVSGAAPVLEVEIIAFEEAAEGMGRVQLRYRLVSGPTVLDRGEVTREQRATDGKDFATTAQAIGAAMDAASAQIADAVVKALSAAPERPTSGVAEPNNGVSSLR